MFIVLGKDDGEVGGGGVREGGFSAMAGRRGVRELMIKELENKCDLSCH